MKKMAKILSGIPRVLNNRDEIMIRGIDWQDHNANLKPTLPRIEDHNHTLRKEKCEFGQTTMDFHGHTLTADGLRPFVLPTNASLPIAIYWQLFKPL